MAEQPDFHAILATSEPAELGPQPRPSAQSKTALEAKLAPLFNSSDLAQERQELIRALILLWHDHLEDAHNIAQNINNPDGAFVHGIMHRREPDFSNAGYWFHRVGRHPAFSQMARKVTALLNSEGNPDLAAKLTHSGEWDPFAFINACEQSSHGSSKDVPLLRAIQQIEFQTLLDYLLE